MSFRGTLYMLLGLIFIIISIGVFFIDSTGFVRNSFATVLVGIAPPFIALLGIIILLIGRELGKLDAFQKSMNNELNDFEKEFEREHFTEVTSEKKIEETPKKTKKPKKTKRKSSKKNTKKGKNKKKK